MKRTTVTEIMTITDRPVIAIDGRGVITFTNKAFETAFGWKDAELRGQVVTIIMPSHMHDAHNFGFSRFLVTETERILNKSLALPVRCKNETVVEAEHFITGEKVGTRWRFAATITPKQTEK